MLIDREKVLDHIDKLYQSSAMTGLGLEPVIALRDVKALISAETEVNAVPLDRLCEWLADCAAPPANASKKEALNNHEIRVMIWKYFWRKMMENEK